MTAKKENRYTSVFWLLLAEAAVSAIVIGVFALIIFVFPDLLFYETEFYKVITGSALGVAATVINFFTLCYTVNRAVDKYMTERGETEMDEEEAARFANENAAKVQAEVTKSYLLRMLILVAACALLFTKQFDVIAVVVPMLVQRPLIVLIERHRGGNA
jgi:Ca2+/H+ antiporter